MLNISPPPLPTDPLAPLADAIAQRLLAHLNQSQIPNPKSQIDPADLDIPYPVPLILQQLGRRGRPMAYATFQKNYLDTGKIRLIETGDRRTRHVRLSDWIKLKKETGK